MIKLTANLKTILLAVVFLIMGGCAALTVDVDVYKGPLANHEDVLTEQTAVMAIGVKPLLVQLRYQLEEKFHNGNTGINSKCSHAWNQLEALKENDKSLPDFRFCNIYGKQTNQVLSLYDDNNPLPPLMSVKLRENQILYERYEKALRILRPNEEQKKEDKRIWNVITGGKDYWEVNGIPEPEIPSGAMPENPQELDLQNDSEKNDQEVIDKNGFAGKRDEIQLRIPKDKKVVTDAGSFEVPPVDLGEGFETSKESSNVSGESSENNDAIDNESIEKELPFKLQGGNDNKGLRSKKAIIDVIEEELIEEETLTLSDEDKKNVLLAELFEAYKNFIVSDGDRDISAIFKTLNKIEADHVTDDLNSMYFDMVAHKLARIHSARLFSDQKAQDKFVAHIAKITQAYTNVRLILDELLENYLMIVKIINKDGNSENIKNLEELNRFAIRAIAKIMKVNNLSDYDNGAPERNYNRRFRRSPSSSNGEDISKNVPRAVIERQIIEKFKRNPGGYSDKLLNQFKGPTHNGSDDGGREYGFSDRTPSFMESSGSYLTVNLLKEDFEDFKNYRELFFKSVGSFSRGRLAEGLETLITNYLKKVKEDKCTEPKACLEEKELLFDALVRFAEKIRSLANMQVYFNNFDPKYAETTVEKTNLEIDRYVQVLQAVGNSILFHVDELKHNKSYDQKIKNGGSREEYTLSLALPQYSVDALNKLIASFQADVNEIGFDPDKLEMFSEKLVAVKKAQAELEAKKQAEEEAKVAEKDVTKLRIKKKNAHEYLKDLTNPPAASVINQNITYADLIQTMTAQLSLLYDNQIIKAGKLTPDSTKIQDTIDELKKLKAPTPDNLTAPSTLFTGIKEELKNNLSLAIQEEDKAKNAVIAHAGLVQTANSTLVSVKQVLTDAQEAEVTRRKNVFDTLEKYRGKIREKIITAEIVRKPEAVKDKFVSILTEIQAGLTGTVAEIDNKKKKLTDTIAALKNRLPQIRFPLPMAYKGPMDAKEVMDHLISTLKYERITAIKESGPNSASVNQITAALKAAYEHRADMVQIRPAVSYLRTSFPSTTLQADSSVEGENMLIRDFFKNMSIVGELSKPTGRKKQEAQIQRQIDKTYWQNINHLSLSGGGDVNYVVMKDDIGNWVIKNYSANPKDIIKSAQKLAMLGMGPGFGDPGLANRLPNIGGNNAANSVANAAGANTPEPQTSLEKSFVKFKKDYDENTATDLKEIKVTVNGLEGSIISKLDADSTLINPNPNPNLTKIKGVMRLAVDSYLRDVKEEIKEGVLPGDEINTVMKRMIDFYQALDRGIHKAIVDPAQAKVLNPGDTSAQDAANELKKAKEDYEAAKNIMSEIVRADVTKYYDRRIKTVGRYRSAISFATETVNQ